MRLGSTALATKRVERRLAAILAADVAGYSRLIGANEEGTLAALKAHRRELIELKIIEHRCRIVKTTGDGTRIRHLGRGPAPNSVLSQRLKHCFDRLEQLLIR